MGKTSENQDFRHLRAQVGGLRRSLDKALADLDTSRQSEAEAWERCRQVRERLEDVDPSLGRLRRDLGHAAKCADPECRACAEIRRRLAVDAPTYERRDALAERLRRGDLLLLAARELVSVARDRRPGSAHKRAIVGKAIQAVLDDELDRAEAALAAVGAKWRGN